METNESQKTEQSPTPGTHQTPPPETEKTAPDPNITPPEFTVFRESYDASKKKK